MDHNRVEYLEPRREHFRQSVYSSFVNRLTFLIFIGILNKVDFNSYLLLLNE